MVLSALFVAQSTAQEGYPLVVTSESSGEDYVLSLEDLDALDQVEFSTTTIWTGGVDEFSGVPILALLESLELDGTTLRMTALNDYITEFPVSDLEDDAPIIATRINGETMSVREKGPFWVVYPYDRSPDYQTEVVYARSIWQLTEISVVE